MHGVRQLGPNEVLASAPGGSDSIVSETFGVPERLLGRKSQLGVQDAQPATDKALASAHTRTTGVILELRPRSPRLPAWTIGRQGASCNRTPAFSSQKPPQVSALNP